MKKGLLMRLEMTMSTTASVPSTALQGDSRSTQIRQQSLTHARVRTRQSHRQTPATHKTLHQPTDTCTHNGQNRTHNTTEQDRTGR